MMKISEGTMEKKLDALIHVSRHLLALELWRSGATKADIGKHLHVAKSEVVRMLRGLNKADGG